MAWACRPSLPMANFTAAHRHTAFYASGKLLQVACRWLFTGYTVQSYMKETLGFLNSDRRWANLRDVKVLGQNPD
ncbi:hypothetical protein LXL04_010296 [Taraxacum kok-saghyz]